ncbi:DUF6035 family protein [Leisingera caerulea]|uniref:Competence protein n=1 Tax=Leisingera caerulea TaxID=506591 RepID=A0A9Q9M523_LEICA|nr:DUF6035 family protein [Leisingera caerulea]UWQ55959.1 hypothetical protein K3721_19185 [Leisingera caerulea]
MTFADELPERAIPTALDGQQAIPRSIRELMTNPALTKELRHRSFRARTSGEKPPLVCACCGEPVFIAMAPRRDVKLPYFKHFNDRGTDCPWITGSTSDQRAVRARQYRGRQTSPRHDKLVLELCSMLAGDPEIQDVAVERYCSPTASDGHGRFPDVYAEHIDGRRFAFELQLSTTLLGEIAARRAFYLAEGIQLFWVMDNQAKDLDRAAFQDVIHDHSFDVFLIDERIAALARSENKFLLGRKALRGSVLEARPNFSLDDVTFTGLALPFVEDGLTSALLETSRAQRRPLIEWIKAEQPVRQNWDAFKRMPVPRGNEATWKALDTVDAVNLGSLMAVVYTCCQLAKRVHLKGTDFPNYDTGENSLSALLNSWCSARDRAPLVNFLDKTVDALKLRDELNPSTIRCLDGATSVDAPVARLAAALLAFFFAEIHDPAVREALQARRDS